MLRFEVSVVQHKVIRKKRNKNLTSRAQTKILHYFVRIINIDMLISYKSVYFCFPYLGIILDAFVVQLLSCVQLFVTWWTAAWQAPLSFTTSQCLLKFMSIESVILSNHLILCHHLLILPSIFPSIRVFSKESALCIRWPKSQSYSFKHLSFSWII